MRKQTNSGKRLDGKELILAEADKRFKRETRRIRKYLATAPSREKYIQSEIDFIDRLFHTPKQITLRDCILDTFKGGFKQWYYMIDTRGYPIEYVRMLRHHYRMYLSGIINFSGEEMTDKAKLIADAIMYYKLEEWLPTQLVKDLSNLYSLIKNTDKNREELDRILKECDEGLKSPELSLMQYAALYLLIDTEYRHIFRPGTSFARLQRELDAYFGQNTGGYKPNKVATTASELKNKHLWIDQLFPSH